jgi:pimeloyl-ACP methyl ester carboxylesterase
MVLTQAAAFCLDQIFIHKTTTHEYQIRWTRRSMSSDVPLPTVVLIHGTPWSSTVWRDLTTSLLSRYDVYVYDHPGFGLSPPPRRLSKRDDDDSERADLDGSLVLRAEASAALFKHWNLPRPPHVVAHDNGGLVSLRLRLEHQIPLASLCLVDVVAIGPFGLPFFKLVAENQAVFTAIPPNLVEGLVRAYVKTATYKPVPLETEDMLCGPWLEGGSQGSDRFLREMVQAHHREVGTALENEYGRVARGELTTPIKIIWGRDDAWLPVEIAHRLQKALGVKPEDLVVIPEAGHLIHYDQPGPLALEVGLWLDKHSRSL